jgi:hypothetical protein
MSDEDIASSPEHARSTKDHVAPAKDPMTNAFSFLSKRLDNALEQQKKDIVNSPGFSLSEIALIVRQWIPFIFIDRVPAVFVPYLNSLISHNYISLNFINSFNG